MSSQWPFQLTLGTTQPIILRPQEPIELRNLSVANAYSTATTLNVGGDGYLLNAVISFVIDPLLGKAVYVWVGVNNKLGLGATLINDYASQHHRPSWIGAMPIAKGDQVFLRSQGFADLAQVTVIARLEWVTTA